MYGLLILADGNLFLGACCCSIFSVWAVILLVRAAPFHPNLALRYEFAVGASLNFGYRKIDNYEIPNDSLDHVATQCYIAAAVYSVFVVLGAVRFYCMRRSGRA